jgi:SAM-dependent methyltransferase
MGPPRPLLLAGAAGAAALGAALWWRRNPSPCPYGQRFWVQAPHPFITRARLREALVPRPGETVLEVGPGTGYYTTEVAEWIRPGGTLHVFDIQQDMLDHTLRRTGERGLDNVVAARGDARELPYPDDTFDAAYLVTVLGEIPDQDRALAELARVLKPDGRLVLGEIGLDPHMVRAGLLARRAPSAGLRMEARLGPRFGYFARLRPETST